MILTYTKTKETGYISSSDEWEEFGDDFDYEPNIIDEYTALANFIYNDYFPNSQFNQAQKSVIIEALYNFIRDSEMATIDALEKYYFEDLKDWFEKEAYNNIGE